MFSVLPQLRRSTLTGLGWSRGTILFQGFCKTQIYGIQGQGCILVLRTLFPIIFSQGDPARSAVFFAKHGTCENLWSKFEAWGGEYFLKMGYEVG